MYTLSYKYKPSYSIFRDEMCKKIISKVEAALGSFVPRKLLVVRKTVSRFLGQANRRILFEFLILTGLLSSVGMIAASRWSTTTIASRGNLLINGVGVYDNGDCSIATTYLDWGTLEPGSAKSITLYIRNEGNRQATIFMTAENWNPVSASNYMQLSWNCGGQMLNPEEVAKATLTLSVSSTAENIQSFSFDVIIGVDE